MVSQVLQLPANRLCSLTMGFLAKKTCSLKSWKSSDDIWKKTHIPTLHSLTPSADRIFTLSCSRVSVRSRPTTSTAPPVSCQIWSQRQLEECHQNQEYILQLIKIGFQFSSRSRPTPSVTRQILSERLEECRENQSAINHLLPLLAAAKDDTSAAWNV